VTASWLDRASCARGSATPSLCSGVRAGEHEGQNRHAFVDSPCYPLLDYNVNVCPLYTDTRGLGIVQEDGMKRPFPKTRLALATCAFVGILAFVAIHQQQSAVWVAEPPSASKPVLGAVPPGESQPVLGAVPPSASESEIRAAPPSELEPVPEAAPPAAIDLVFGAPTQPLLELAPEPLVAPQPAPVQKEREDGNSATELDASGRIPDVGTRADAATLSPVPPIPLPRPKIRKPTAERAPQPRAVGAPLRIN